MTGMSSRAILLVVAAVAAGGCVSQGQHDALVTRNRIQGEQIVDLKQQLEAKDAELQALRSAPPVQDPAVLAALDKVKAERDQLQAALEDARGQIAKAADISLGGPLPAQLDRALVELSQANPGLMEYDPDRGMVRFRSDLTFALGSTTVSKAGVTALQRLASIVNSPIAQKYDVRVIGHTDNVPVKNASNKARFGDNWGLSAGRSISVGRVLMSAGLSPSRLEIAGRGEHQPVVPNVGSKGAAANRRVEIFLVPRSSGRVAQAPAGPIAPAPKQKRADAEGPEAFK